MATRHSQGWMYGHRYTGCGSPALACVICMVKGMAPSPDRSSLATRLFAQHGAAVRRYLCRLTNDSTAAEDLVQDVYLRIVRASDNYESRERERAWIFRIARNVFLDHYRTQSRRERVPADAGQAAVRPMQVIRLELQSALDRLGREDREAFLLCELGGLTYEEIGTTMGLSVPSVRSRIYRARLALRGMLLHSESTIFPAGRSHDDDD